MPEVRDVLNRGADVNPGLPDVPELMRRARAAQRRRAGLVAGMVAAVVVSAVAVGDAVLSQRGGSAPEPAAPAPGTSLPTVAGPLAPGTYAGSSVDLDVRFTVPGPGWTLAAVDDGWVTLRHGRSTVALQRWEEVVDPVADPVALGDSAPRPADLTDWLTSHPRLDVAGVEQTAVGGATWTTVAVTVAEPLTTTPAECNALPCILLAITGDEPLELLARDRARVLLAPDDGVAPDRDAPPVVVVTQPRTRSSDPAVERLISSLTTP